MHKVLTLNCVLNSKTLSGSQASRHILKFIVEKSLAGCADEIKEYTIATQALGRPEDFDPRADNIVRVQVQRLRKKLEDYYRSEGTNDPMRIVIPLGHYHAEFNQVIDEVSTPPSSESTLPRRTRLKFAIPQRFLTQVLPWAVVGVLFVLVLALRPHPSSRISAVNAPGSIAGTGLGTKNVLLSRLFDPNHQTYIVAADSSWYVLQRLLGKELSLDEYLSRRYLNSLSTRDLKIVAGGQYTDLADINVLSKLLRATAPFPITSTVRYARYISTEDLRSNNFILLGSTASNPWGKLFTSMRNFHESADMASGNACYVNAKPLPGESDRYCSGLGPGGMQQDYCRISFLPNLSRTGNGLIIEGTTGEGTQAAGEFVTSPDLDSNIRKYLKLGPYETNIPYFELLLKASRVPGTPLPADYVTHRVLR